MTILLLTWAMIATIAAAWGISGFLGETSRRIESIESLRRQRDCLHKYFYRSYCECGISEPLPGCLCKVLDEIEAE